MLPIIASIISGLLTNNLPKLAQAVADKGVDYVQDKLGLELKPEMTPAEVAAMREAADKHDEFRMTTAANLATGQEVELTKRLQSDMASDSWLSKNVRPATLVYILTAYLILAILDGNGFKVAESYVTLLGQWGMLVMSFYFGGRSVEKVMEMMTRQKTEVRGQK
jgi:hypothetical protein